MNCANHPDRERSAFCQNCGKPLCTECVRTIGNSIFCEPCYTLRAAGAATTAGPSVYAAGCASSPGVAALLGLIPGVGAMYNGQYAKGIVHLVVFAVLVSLADQSGVFGLFVAGWVFYMAFEAYHTARARLDGTPLPNPFGLNDVGERLGFGRNWTSGMPGAGPYGGPAAGAPGAAAGYTAPAAGYTPTAAGYTGTTVPGAEVPPVSGSASGTYTPPWSQAYAPPVTNWGAPQEGWGAAYGVPPGGAGAPVPDPTQPMPRRIPVAAIWLIGLGVLFLFGNSGIFWMRARFLGPLILIAFGVWVFVRRMTSTGLGLENDGTPDYTWRLARAARGSVWMVVTGFVWLLDVFGILYWHQSWPIFLIVGGLLLFVRHSLVPAYPSAGYPPYAGVPVAPGVTPQPPVETSTAIAPAADRPGFEEGR